MPEQEESFDIDTLIPLKEGVQQKALGAFFESILKPDAVKRKDVARFATRAAWRVLPEILADDAPGFEEPIKCYVFAASCRALFAATHPDAAYDPSAASAASAAYDASASASAYASASARASRAASYADRAATYADRAAAYSADAADAAAHVVENKPLWKPLLLAMREDLSALQSNQMLTGRELWPATAWSPSDVQSLLSAFRKDLKRYKMIPEISIIYKALLEGRIKEAIVEYKPNLFNELFKSTKSAFDEWITDRQSPTTRTINVPFDTLHPEVPSNTDHLNQEPLAKTLSNWLSKNDSHATIGLFGDSGVGKSTFVNLLCNHLNIRLDAEAASAKKQSWNHYKTGDYIGGEFNAWQYEHTANIQAGLVQELIAALEAKLKWWEKFKLAAIFAFKHNRANLMIAAIFALVAGGIFYFVPSQWFSALAGIGGLVAAWHYIARAVAHPLAKELLTYLRLPSFGKELGTIPVMREQVQAMVNLRLNFFKKKQRLLFVVDDLDRCSPDSVFKTLEAVQLIMHLPNVTVLIAIDQKIALASLALRYKEFAVHCGADPQLIAREYLGKVVHVSITLENPPPEAVVNYLSNKLWTRDDPDETKEKAGSETPTGSRTPITTLNDSAQTPSSMPTITSPGLSKTQKKAFIHWANQFGLANPRQIKRLDNAYNLIRMCYGDKDGDKDHANKPNDRLAMLMWIEYCRELPSDSYTVIRTCVRAEIAGEPEAVVKPLRAAVDACNPQVGKFWDAVKAVWKNNADDPLTDAARKTIRDTYHRTRAFVLPAIEREKLKNEAREVTQRNR